MSFLIPPDELAPLFATGAYLSGRNVSSRYKLLRVGAFRGTLSLFRIKFRQATWNSLIQWLIMSIVFSLLMIACTYLSNGLRFNILAFVACYLPLLFPLAKLLLDSLQMYSHAEQWCLKVSNSIRLKNQEQLLDKRQLIEMIRESSAETWDDFLRGDVRLEEKN